MTALTSEESGTVKRLGIALCPRTRALMRKRVAHLANRHQLVRPVRLLISGDEAHTRGCDAAPLTRVRLIPHLDPGDRPVSGVVPCGASIAYVALVARNIIKGIVQGRLGDGARVIVAPVSATNALGVFASC